MLEEIIGFDDNKREHHINPKPHKRINKNTPKDIDRVNFRKERVSAIRAKTRKLAVIIWNMVVKGLLYINPEGYLFLNQKRKLGRVKRIKMQINKFGLTNEDIGSETT